MSPTFYVLHGTKVNYKIRKLFTFVYLAQWWCFYDISLLNGIDTIVVCLVFENVFCCWVCFFIRSVWIFFCLFFRLKMILKNWSFLSEVCWVAAESVALVDHRSKAGTEARDSLIAWNSKLSFTFFNFGAKIKKIKKLLFSFYNKFSSDIFECEW